MKVVKRILIGLLIVILLVVVSSFAVVAYATLSHPVEYGDLVNEYGEKYKVDPILLLSVIRAESSFQPEAKSPMGARGLMQIMPETGKWIAEKLKVEFDEEKLDDPRYNIEFGTYYLSYLLDHFSEKEVALAAYNGGIGNVTKWLKDESMSKDGKTLDDIPFDETRYYVKKVEDNEYVYRVFYGDSLEESEINRSDFDACIQNYVNTLKYFYHKF